MRRLVLSIACLDAFYLSPQLPYTAKDISFDSITVVVHHRRNPLWQWQAGSEQWPPLNLAESPRQRILTTERVRQPRLASSLKPLAETQLRFISNNLGLENFEIEMWPVRNDVGELTWVFNRYRAKQNHPWRWFSKNQRLLMSFEKQYKDLPLPIFPQNLDPLNDPKDAQLIFADPTELPGLYHKPKFGNTIWVSGNEVYAAWPNPTQRAKFRKILEANKNLKVKVIPQPSWFGDRPIVFAVKLANGICQWPATIQWAKPHDSQISPLAKEVVIKQWPVNFSDSYREQIKVLTGDAEAIFPVSDKKLFFTKKNNAQPDHQLELLQDYLQEYYKTLGLSSRRQTFYWNDTRGHPKTYRDPSAPPQDDENLRHSERSEESRSTFSGFGMASKHSNLIVTIPGSLPPEQNKPVILADHIDTAFSEDVYDQTGERKSNPGANDNATATATLIASAKVLRELNLKHDIWLVHLTGEEFPADSLGARMLTKELLQHKQDLQGVILIDMIGHNENNEFQINSGQYNNSVEIARLALDAALNVGPQLKPLYRSIDDRLSYLYNTDGLIFSNAGYGIILFNEKLNRSNLFDRHDYHTAKDTVDNVDLEFATTIAKIAIETAARLANVK